MNKPIRSAVGADDAHEHIDPGIRTGHNTLMLSGSEASRDLVLQTLRCRSG